MDPNPVDTTSNQTADTGPTVFMSLIPCNLDLPLLRANFLRPYSLIPK